MDTDLVRVGLARLGDVLGMGEEVEFTIIGGSAGLLAGMLPRTVTTSDVDAIHFQPPKFIEDIQQSARDVGAELGLSSEWLSTDAGLFTNALPADWLGRRTLAGKYGRLRVIGRLDFITMKFFAHRGVDLEHLERLQPTKQELEFVREHLQSLVAKIPQDRSKIEMAIHVAETWSETE